MIEELANANETINFLSSLTGKNPQMIKNNIGGAGQGAGGGDSGPRGSTPTRALDGGMGGGPGGVPGVNRNNNTGGSYNGPNGTGNKVLQRQDSAVTQKAGQDGAGGGGPNRDEIDRINANRVGTAGTVNTQSGTNNAANETKDAITGRIIHTVNMMKEVLQGNLGLRETIQK